MGEHLHSNHLENIRQSRYAQNQFLYPGYFIRVCVCLFLINSKHPAWEVESYLSLESWQGWKGENQCVATITEVSGKETQKGVQNNKTLLFTLFFFANKAVEWH